MRFLLLLSPTWLFAIPSLGLLLCGLLLITAPFTAPLVGLNPLAFGAYWTILAGALIGLGHQGSLLALTAELAGIRGGYRRPGRIVLRLCSLLSLEVMLAVGIGLAFCGLAILVGVFVVWTAHQQQAFDSVLPAVIGTTLLTVGLQNVLGGFLLAVLAGNIPQFLDVAIVRDEAKEIGAEAADAI